MPTITSIEPQKKKSDRFNVYVDGKFRFGLDAGTVVKSGLKVGREISEKEVEKLVFENEVNKLTEKALRFLSFRPRSEREIRNRLRKKVSRSQPYFAKASKGKRVKMSRNTPDNIETVIDRLKHLGYVNDLEFSQWWVEQRQTQRKPRGQRLIRSELYQKGVDKKIVDQVLPEDEEDEIERALKAAQKKLRSYEKLDRRKFKQKMSQHLARRGFDWEIIKETLNRLIKPD